MISHPVCPICGRIMNSSIATIVSTSKYRITNPTPPFIYTCDLNKEHVIITDFRGRVLYYMIVGGKPFESFNDYMTAKEVSIQLGLKCI